MSNDKEREAAYDMIDRFLRNNLGSDEDYAEYSNALDLVLGASLAASAGSPEINGQLYTALNNLFTHLGMEGCITADHAFVWDAMTALKRIDGGVHLDNLAVPVDPDAHRDDMLAAVQLLEGGEWAEHFAKTPIGMRLEDQITKLHNEVAASAGSEPVASIYITPAGEREIDDWKVKLPPGRNILYTHPSPPEGAGWRPIAEAPQNGRTLLLGYFNSAGKWRTTRGQWMSQDYIDEYAEDPDCMSPGWYETTVEDDDGKCWPIDPTHFMPTPPAPPASEAKGA